MERLQRPNLHPDVPEVGREYSHIRIDANRQALDALDAARRSTAHNGDGTGDGADQTEIPAVVEVSDDLTSQSAVERVAALR